MIPSAGMILTQKTFFQHGQNSILYIKKSDLLQIDLENKVYKDFSNVNKAYSSQESPQACSSKTF